MSLLANVQTPHGLFSDFYLLNRILKKNKCQL